MPFWSTQTVRTKFAKEGVEPFLPDNVKQGALELRMGPEAAISGETAKIIRLAERQELSVPPGQFALLLTEEMIVIPHKAVAFISLKTGVKSRGLVNVSGFHVDPGYRGRLKFWVYNAGQMPVIVKRGDPTFLIWYTDFDHAVSDPYPNKFGQAEITADDLTKMQGKMPTPASLAEDIKELQKKYDMLHNRTGLLIGAAVTLFFALLTLVVTRIMSDPKPSEIRVRVEESRAK